MCERCGCWHFIDFYNRGDSVELAVTTQALSLFLFFFSLSLSLISLKSHQVSVGLFCYQLRRMAGGTCTDASNIHNLTNNYCLFI